MNSRTKWIMQIVTLEEILWVPLQWPVEERVKGNRLYIQSLGNQIWIQWLLWLLPAATKLGQGNIFTGVCLSTGGVCLSACWYIPPGTRPPRSTPPGTKPPREQTPPWSRHLPGADPPPKQTPGYGQPAAGTHPTGMHSCSILSFIPKLTMQSWRVHNERLNGGCECVMEFLFF